MGSAPAAEPLLSSPAPGRILDRAAEAGRGIFFNPQLEALAGEVVAALDPQGQGFNGLHLRLEADAAEWHAMVGGADVSCRGTGGPAWRARAGSHLSACCNHGPR